MSSPHTLVWKFHFPLSQRKSIASAKSHWLFDDTPNLDCPDESTLTAWSIGPSVLLLTSILFPRLQRTSITPCSYIGFPQPHCILKQYSESTRWIRGAHGVYYKRRSHTCFQNCFCLVPGTETRAWHMMPHKYFSMRLYTHPVFENQFLENLACAQQAVCKVLMTQVIQNQKPR